MSAEADLHNALAAWVADRFPGGRLERIWPLSGGVSSKMTAFEVVTAEGPRRLIHRQPGQSTGAGQHADARREHRLLTWLNASGANVPAVFGENLDGSVFGRPGFFIALIDAAPDYDPADPAAFGRAFADGLAGVHRLVRSRQGLEFLPEMAARADRILADAERAAPAGSDERRWADILRGRFPIEVRNRPTLLHGDYWPGNVLWKDGALASIVDCEDSSWGDPLADLAIARLDLLWMAGEAAAQAFTDRYAATLDIDLTRLAEWDLSAALRPYGYLELWSSTWPAHGRPDITAQTMDEALHGFAERALSRLA